MLTQNVSRIISEVREAVPELKNARVSDFRDILFPQNFVLGVTADPSGTLTQAGPTPQNFASGAILYNIRGAATPRGQPDNPWLQGLDRFRIQFNYTQSDALSTTQGIASALLGDGRYGGSPFPGKWLYFPPQQNIITTVQNLTNEILDITIAYECLTWRFAQ